MTDFLQLKLLLLLCGFYIISTSTLLGQDGYEQGYIVTNQNDTLYGLTKDRKIGSFGGIYESVRFKGKGLRKRFSPRKIKSYEKGDVIFRSMFLNGEKTFLKVVSEGYVSHYIFELQEQGEQLVLDVDYLQKGKNTTLVRATQGIFGLKQKKLIQFFSDCPQLVDKIKNKEFKYVSELVSFYNQLKKEN